MNQEDAHIAALDFAPGMSLFAVFDGHGGEEVSKYCAKNFVTMLKGNIQFKKQNYEEALKMTYTWIDRILISKAAKADVTKGAQM